MRIEVEEEMLYSWNPASLPAPGPDGTIGKWYRVVGERKIMIGASSADIRLCEQVKIGF